MDLWFPLTQSHTDTDSPRASMLYKKNVMLHSSSSSSSSSSSWSSSSSSWSSPFCLSAIRVLPLLQVTVVWLLFCSSVGTVQCTETVQGKVRTFTTPTTTSPPTPTNTTLKLHIPSTGGGGEEKEGERIGGGSGGEDSPPTTTTASTLNTTTTTTTTSFTTTTTTTKKPTTDSQPHIHPLPSSLEVDVRLGGRDVHLRLSRAREFESSQLPVYVLSTDEEGRLQRQRATLNDTAEFAVYQDVQNEGTFGVFREKDENGTLRYKLQGMVHSDGHVYKLNSKGRHRHPHHLSSAATNNNNSHSSPRRRRNALDDDDDDGDDRDVDEEEEEGMEEFEVEVFSDRMAEGADSLPAPPGPKPTTRKQTTTMKTMSKTMRKRQPEDPLAVAVVSSAPSPSLLPTPGTGPLSPPHHYYHNNNDDNDDDNDDDSNTTPEAPQRRRRSREKRQGTHQVYVDVVALADYGVFNAWYGRSAGATAALKMQNTLANIRLYYAIVMNGVNLIYKTITSMSYSINVRLTGIVVSATPQTGRKLTEQYRVAAQSGSRWDSVDANLSLNALRSWVLTTDLLPAYDHVMLFTGYDLTKGTGQKGITGLAFTGTVCRTEGQAVSIVEDLGGFQCVFTAAHELGHGLSAVHDGTGNPCRSEDRYVMAYSSFLQTPSNKLNPWRFSSCSVSSFTTFIRDTLLSSRGRQCLNTALTVNNTVPVVTSSMPGQLYDPDQQCRQVYGPQSRLCRGEEFGKSSDICTDMYCFDPLTSSTCIKLMAAWGTTCGNRKWCQSGQCVYDARAPVVPDSCVHGDQPGAAFEGKDCDTFVRGFPGYCYQSVVRLRCCSSCAKYSLMFTDCLYGDKLGGCSSSSCPLGDLKYLTSCCGSCNYGTPFTTTPTLPGSCRDNTAFTFNQMTCTDLVARQPELCYDVRVSSQCCSSCLRVSSGIHGCEYGDRDPARCRGALQVSSITTTSSSSNTQDSCDSLQSVCCKTCSSTSSSSSSIAWLNSLIVILLVIVVGGDSTVLSLI